MLVAVAGGKLQGVEAAYLARKAGWEVLLLDKDDGVPASGLCHRFLRIDITQTGDPCRLLRGVDLILPALENDAALAALKTWSEKSGIPMAFDSSAYAVSSSKLQSGQLFDELHLLTPRPWPKCHFPVIIKPDRESGSHNVQILHTPGQLMTALQERKSRMVPIVQQYLSGPSYSIEVLGAPDTYHPLQVTELHVDAFFDCKRVIAPSGLPADMISDFKHMAVALAQKLHLRGIMDVEVILHNEQLQLLEIDARLPSQTPTAVYWSTGMNMVALLGEMCTKGTLIAPVCPPQPNFSIYEHLRLTGNRLEVAGERIMSDVGPLHVQPHFFEANEALTNFHQGRSDWVATLIWTGDTEKEVWEKRSNTLKNICTYAGIQDVVDHAPQVTCFGSDARAWQPERGLTTEDSRHFPNSRQTM